MRRTLIELNYEDDVEITDVIAQLAELDAIPGVTVVTYDPTNFSDLVFE